MNNNGHLPVPRPGPECASFIDLLPLLGVGTLDEQEADRLHLHLTTCAYCQTQRTTYDRMDVVLRHSFGVQETLLFSSEQIMAITNDEQRPEPTPSAAPTLLDTRRPRRARRFVSLLSAIAAVLLITAVTVAVFASHTLPPKGIKQTITGSEPATSTPVPTPQATPYIPAPDDSLEAIRMLSATEGWAVGGKNRHALIIHYLSGRWFEVPAPTNAALGVNDSDLTDIFMLPSGEGWAIGRANLYMNNIPSAILIHYKAGTWTKELVLPDAEFWNVDMLSASDGWIAGGGKWEGGQGAAQSILLHYNGTTWASMQVPGAGIYALSMISSTEGWASIGTGLLHYNGNTWMPVNGPGAFDLFGLDMLSANDGWGFGVNNDIYHHNNTQNILSHYNGKSWAQVQSPVSANPNAQILALSMDSSSDGWAVGYIDNGDMGTNKGTVTRSWLFLHYIGGRWVQVKSEVTGGNLGAISMISADDGWAAGGGDNLPSPLIHYQNGVWTSYQA